MPNELSEELGHERHGCVTMHGHMVILPPLATTFYPVTVTQLAGCMLALLHD